MVKDLTPYEKDKVWVPTMNKDGEIIIVNRFPLYELGTRVKSKKTGNIGTIVQTYNHTKTDKQFRKNSDKYGVKFESTRRNSPVNWMSVNEFLVENPIKTKYQEKLNEFKELNVPKKHDHINLRILLLINQLH